MASCSVAQSGGPTTAISASSAGVVHASQLSPVYDHIYGGLDGIERILEDHLYDLVSMSGYENRLLCQTPSPALGSCRYKLKRNDEADHRKLVEIMNKHDIEILFYTGENDPMDTVDALSQWAKTDNIDKRSADIPKTVDNDLMVTDHCPGLASGAKFANEIVSITQLDYNMYTCKKVFILEAMGRDAGWPADSIIVTGRADLIVLPEVDFDREKLLAQAKKCVDEKGKCYIVTSEGTHYTDGIYVTAGETVDDGSGYTILDGAGENLESMILEAGIAPRAKVQDLSIVVRSSNFAQSLADVTRTFEPGASAHSRSTGSKLTGHAVAVQREYVNGRYNVRFISGLAENFANHVKHVPIERILPDYQGLIQGFCNYITPLIQNEPILIVEDGISKTVIPFNKR